MGKENERKYLLRENGAFFTSEQLKGQIPDTRLEGIIRANGTPILQGYLPLEVGYAIWRDIGTPEFAIAEARLREKGNKYIFTVKGDGSAERDEWEESICREMFGEYWPHVEKSLRKIRMEHPWCGLTAELDLYVDGRDLIVGEVELPKDLAARDAALVALVPLGKDITDDKRYKNKNLALPYRLPFSSAAGK